MLGLALRIGERHLVRAERALGGQPVDQLRSRPALRRAQDDHRPARTRGGVGRISFSRATLDRGDLVADVVERRRHQLVHRRRLGALDEARLVAVAAQQRAQLLLRDPREHGRRGDLVAVEVQDRQHRAVASRIEELVRVPARGERTGFGLAVADDAADEQIRVVERRAERVHERVAELAALVDRSRRLRRDVARDPTGERELAKQPAQSLLVVADVRVELGVGALEVGVGDESRAAVAGTGHVDHAEVTPADQAVEVRVDEVQARRRAPVPEQPRLDVLDPQRLAQQRIRQQVDLTDRQVVGRTPVRVDRARLLVSERIRSLGQGALIVGRRSGHTP